MASYAIFSQPYYDAYEQKYKNILTINKKPEGPLRQITKQIKFYPLSPFKRTDREQCGYAFCLEGNRLATTNEIPDLFSFLMTNGYTIDTPITKMLNESDVRINDNVKLVAFFHFWEKWSKIHVQIRYHPLPQIHPQFRYHRLWWYWKKLICNLIFITVLQNGY